MDVVSQRQHSAERPATAQLQKPVLRTLAGVSLIAGISAVLSWWPMWAGQFLLGVIYVFVVSSFAASGAFLLSDRRTGRTGWAMIIAAFCYEASWWWMWPDSWQVGPAPLISFLIGYWWFGVGGLALLRYPAPVLGRRHERIYFACLAAWIVGLKLFIALVSLPQWNRWSEDAWWPALAPNEQLFRVSSRVFTVGLLAIALLLPVLLLLKLRRTRGVERADTLPVTAAAIAIGLVGSSYLAAQMIDFSSQVTDALRTITAVAALVAPVAFLVTLTQRRLAVTAVADLIGPLVRCQTIREVQAVLRQALDDPRLTLAVRSHHPRDYVASDGYPLTASEMTKWWVEVPGRSGRPIALMLVDPVWRRRETFVRAAAAASGIALEDGVLQQDLTAQLYESQTSRQRLTENSMSERRRLASELHDGVQASLLGARTHLTRAQLRIRRRQVTGDPREHLNEVGDAVGEAQSALQHAIEDLRGLSRGIHPDTLVDHGLRPALLRVMPTQFPVILHVDDARAPRAVESMLYFLVCEALNNVIKHAHATSAEVRVTIADGEAAARISDNGCGGARADPGSGLAALQDRVRSLRGDLTIVSRADTGTTISAVIPCG